jgi:hypothetical protein
LQARLDVYREMVPLSTSNHPEGYILNDSSRVPDFIMPCGNGYFQAAYWVKQLAEGQVMGLP